MISLDDFIKSNRAKEGFTLLRVYQDINVAGKLKSYFLRKNDIVYVEDDIAELLVKRGSASLISIPDKTKGDDSN